MESDYYKAHSIFEQKVALEKELHHIDMQLAGNQINLNDLRLHLRKSVRRKLSQLQKERQEYNEEKASLSYQTKKLLEAKEQSEQLQLLEQKKAELHELVKKWAAQKVVVESIKQIMRQLKEERLPEVLENAQYYFHLLTNHSYEQLVLSPEGSFEAVKSSGQRFKIAELSQATKEQAYISLRLALAVSLQGKAPFPIIMDDPFVHFDRVRLQQVVQLMAELQKEHQLLYFTCHDKMQYVWEDASVIQVADIITEKGRDCEMKGITQLRVGEPVDHYLLIKQSTKGVTTVGKPFMSLLLQDKSGDIEAKLWDTNEEHEKLYAASQIVRVGGEIQDYRGKFQLRVKSIRPVKSEEPISINDLVPSSAKPKEEVDGRAFTIFL